MAQPAYNFAASDATRESILLRAALCGPTGSGKTKTALEIATRMRARMNLGPIYFIDSENKSGLRYAYSPRTKRGYQFKHVPMPKDDYSPAAYMAAIDYCERQGAGIIIIDSLSHAWVGTNGVLEQVDKVTANSRSRNQFSEGWKTMTPVQNKMIEKLLAASAHVLFTMRAKTDWVIQENSNGKKEPVKIGMAPVQRDGVDYEPDLFFDMTVPDNSLIVSKSRCDLLTPGEVVRKPGADFADVLIDWLEDAEPSGAPRTLGEALNLAERKALAAAQAKSKDAYKAARDELVQNVMALGYVKQEATDRALQELKDRVASVLGPKGAAADPTHAPPPPSNPAPAEDPDLARMRQIDQGAA